jgi:NAD(P)-dependent dehydrogenase (short-subunit alcohol dehydrogenase family)
VTSAHTLRFDGRVALITGAGKGLGRAYALELASRGATVLVNNRKREPEGESGSADQVVAEIVASGGDASACYHDVESEVAGRAMAELAIDRYGRLDILINNAGVDQHAPMHRLPVADFERIFNINFFGSYYVTRAALEPMRAAGYGRILFSTSTAGLYGLHGLTAYSASKAALIGLTRALAQEGAPKGIHVNAIAPYARTQMTEAHLDTLPADRLAPELVAPVAAWLIHESCAANGDCFIAGCGQIRRAWMVENSGVEFAPVGPLTMEAVAAAAATAMDMTETHPQPDAATSFMSMAPLPTDRPDGGAAS